MKNNNTPNRIRCYLSGDQSDFEQFYCVRLRLRAHNSQRRSLRQTCWGSFLLKTETDALAVGCKYRASWKPVPKSRVIGWVDTYSTQSDDSASLSRSRQRDIPEGANKDRLAKGGVAMFTAPSVRDCSVFWGVIERILLEPDVNGGRKMVGFGQACETKVVGLHR